MKEARPPYRWALLWTGPAHHSWLSETRMVAMTSQITSPTSATSHSPRPHSVEATPVEASVTLGTRSARAGGRSWE